MDKSNFRLILVTIALCTTKGDNNEKNATCLYGKYGDPFILKCINNTNSTSWDGPSSQSLTVFGETPYAHDDEIVPELPNAENLLLVGDFSAGEYNLMVINLTHNEEGYYKCNAIRGKIPYEFRYFLRIKVPPKKLTTNGRNGILIGKAGEEMHITCNVERGVPENETMISLYFKGNVIKKTFAEMLIYSFVPRKVNNRDIFKCAVENLLLDSPLEETIRLKVLYQPSVRFDKNEYNFSVYEGTDFSITCFSDSNQVTTEILWEANDTIIEKQIQHLEHLPLNIANIQQHHEGKYTCVAKNHLGIGKKSIYITVECCQVKIETTNATVIVIISVILIVTIFLGVLIFLARDDLSVDNQMYQSRDDTADNETTVHRHIGAEIQDNRMDLSGGSASYGCVNAQGNSALNYAEIIFTPGPSESRCVVHGKENMTIYSDVVLPVASVAVH
ncbi:unnamed protein product [Mytilus coruscus]|uniref:Ig-like domain-containing protein n=1 Tax=Mytilus coruscus TaxID=42192 RepID=A0A6J8AQ23_MYTCO|nr:unnamed protein product [Mytilus coruscus]